MNKSRGFVISVVGTHAGETIREIIGRKRKEIRRAGKTFWLYKSQGAQPSAVQRLAHKSAPETLCYFIHSSSRGGARPTKEQEVSQFFSEDNVHWQKIPDEIKVTGSSKISFALVLKEIIFAKEDINLWDYSDSNNPKEPIRIRLGSSTVCAIDRSSADHPGKIKSNIREVVAVGKLTEPYCVWVKPTKPLKSSETSIASGGKN